MEKLTGSVYAETGFNGCNVSFVKTKEGVVMVDTPQIPSEALKWREMIDQYGPIRYLINSEPHSDHFSGNYFFEGTIVGHEGSHTAITNASLEQMTEMINVIAPKDISHLEYFHFCPPTITYSERLTLYLGNHTFQLIKRYARCSLKIALAPRCGLRCMPASSPSTVRFARSVSPASRTASSGSSTRVTA